MKKDGNAKNINILLGGVWGFVYLCNDYVQKCFFEIICVQTFYFLITFKFSEQ